MRLGITMRVVENTTYPERRDTLSQDWQYYFSSILQESVLVPLLNNPERVVNWIKALKVDGIILSSGNDWGEAPERDDTERRLVDYCLAANLPILGACRGMQVLNVLFGGTVVTDIESVGKETHVAQDHLIQLTQPSFRKVAQSGEIKVNSFHNQGIMLDGLAREFVVFASTSNGVVEGYYHPTKPVLGIQWHPERKTLSREFDEKVISRLFREGVFWA